MANKLKITTKSKIIISFSSIAIIIIGTILVSNLHHKPIPEVPINTNTISSSLPVNTDPIKNPMLYDYIYSTLGDKLDFNFNPFGNFYGILVNNDDLSSKNNNGGIFIESYYLSNYYPCSSTGYVYQGLKDMNWKIVQQSFNSWPKDRKIKEGNYTLFILAASNGDTSLANYSYKENTTKSWNQIDLTKLIFPKSWLSKNIDMGWDSSWLRKPQFADNILKGQNIDIKDKFFDKYRLGQLIVVKNNKTSETKNIRVIGTNLFKIETGIVWTMPLKQLNIQLQSEGFDIVK